jgi:hypothetical protein
MDEFALWTRLQDVYWSEEGRSSLEAIAVVTVFGGLVVVGVQPFKLDDPGSALTVSAAIVVTIAVSIVAFLKRRILLGAVGIFILPVGVVGALRPAQPASPWAHWFYEPGSSRVRRARERYDDPRRWTKRVRRRVEDAVGGRPSDP